MRSVPQDLSTKKCWQLRCREFDILLIDDLSRLSRDQVERERVIRRLEFLRIRIIAVTDGYDSETKVATRKIQRGVKNLLNEMRLDELAAPQELKELEARLDRLRKRLKEGDPGMAADELQAAIERAEAKRRQLKNGLQDSSEVTKVVFGNTSGRGTLRPAHHAWAVRRRKSTRRGARRFATADPGAHTLSPKEDGSLWARSALQTGGTISTRISWSG